MNHSEAIDEEPDFALAASETLTCRRNRSWDTYVCISKSLFALFHQEMPNHFPSDSVRYKLSDVMKGVNSYLRRKVIQNTILKADNGRYTCINDPLSDVLNLSSWNNSDELYTKILKHCLALEYIKLDQMHRNFNSNYYLKPTINLITKLTN